MKEREVMKKVYDHFQSGFHCSEVVTKTILDLFADTSANDMIRAASGFGGGIAGTTDELCGAFTGGVLTLGYFFGRESPGEAMTQSGAMIRELKQRFENQFGHLNCASLRNSFGDEGQMGCVRVTAETTVMLAEMLNAYEIKTAKPVESACCEPREQVALGACPFSCGCQAA